MAGPIEFWFDFSSPYAYLGAQRIEAVAEKHGRAVDWRPFLLGVTFKTTGMQPLSEIPLKGDYLKHDLPRSARRMGVPVQMPQPFPFMSVAASRAVIWLKEHHPEKVSAVVRALFHKAFGEGGDISSAAAVVAVAAEAGVDAEELGAAMPDPALKDKLRAEVELANEKGVFGAPYMIVDGEPFWGHDRVDEIDAWLASGGW